MRDLKMRDMVEILLRWLDWKNEIKIILSHLFTINISFLISYLIFWDGSMIKTPLKLAPNISSSSSSTINIVRLWNINHHLSSSHHLIYNIYLYFLQLYIIVRYLPSHNLLSLSLSLHLIYHLTIYHLTIYHLIYHFISSTISHLTQHSIRFWNFFWNISNLNLKKKEEEMKW